MVQVEVSAGSVGHTVESANTAEEDWKRWWDMAADLMPTLLVSAIRLGKDAGGTREQTPQSPAGREAGTRHVYTLSFHPCPIFSLLRRRHQGTGPGL